MALEHFNEPVITGFEIARVVGYGEDQHDCYLILKFLPEQWGAEPEYRWHTCVGGYYFLDRLRGQGYVKSTTGEDWDDFYRINNSLELNGCTKEPEFILKIEE